MLIKSERYLDDRPCKILKVIMSILYNLSWSALVTNVILRVDVLYDRTYALQFTAYINSLAVLFFRYLSSNNIQNLSAKLFFNNAKLTRLYVYLKIVIVILKLKRTTI